MDNLLRQLIKEYKKSNIQSEEEVRSKLIVPLLNVLGYPSYFRAENFPVYEFEGRKPQSPKEADFVLFKDADFANHRKFKQDDIDWVYSNSLLVVEAKKPGEMPDILGQPIFYTVWTKAVAYLVIDGIMIKGYFYNAINRDLQGIESSIDDLPENDSIWNFSFENILRIKNESKFTLSEIISKNGELGDVNEDSTMGDLIIIDTESARDLTEKDIEGIPEETFQYMRNALGKNSTDLNNVQLIQRFLSTTDALLQNDLRYDVPQYIYNIPREIWPASVYINNIFVPIDRGEVKIYYWEDNERFFYESNYLQIEIIYKNGNLIDYDIGFHVLDNNVSKRLNSFGIVRKVLYAKKIKIEINGSKQLSLEITIKSQEKMWKDRALRRSMCEVWCHCLEQMRVIEDFYDINFNLKVVTGRDKINELYESVSFVYDGILLNENCGITIPGGIFDEDIIISEPVLFEDNIKIPLQQRIIHDVCFIPYQSWLMPGRIPMKGTSKEDILRIPGCCRYKIIDDKG